MEHIQSDQIGQTRPTAITLGNFDGLHLGHRKLIGRMQQEAKAQQLRSVVFSFFPHPMFLFHNRENLALIMSPEEKKRAIAAMGVDLYVEYPFTKTFAAMAPEDFGAKQKGNAALLEKLGKEHGVKVIVIPPVMYGGERVSSTRVRKALSDTNLDLAAALLSRPYGIYGEVIHGKQLGRTIGFPTINVVADPEKLFPPNGVYATKTLVAGRQYPGVTNVGVAPTVHGTKKIVETYLFDFHQSVYGSCVETALYRFIRPEQKFPSVAALQQQMQADAAAAREYFEEMDENQR